LIASGFNRSEDDMTRCRLLLCAVLLAALPAGVLAQDQDTRPGIAVFPFTNGGSYGAAQEDLEALTVGLQQMLLTELGQNDAMRVVERGILRDLMAEQDLGASGRVDAQTAARLGRIVGARYAITGVFIDLNGDFRMDGRVIDVETTEILRTEQVRDDRENLYGMLVELAAEITDGLDLPPLPAQVREARAEREVSDRAITLYSRAQQYEDYGRKEQAIELYRQIAQEFPAMVEARERLDQLTSG
jgi:TolB-like protein